MENKKSLKDFVCVYPVVLFVFIALTGFSPADAFDLGETYDKSNWQEIKDMLPAPILEYVKKGDWTIPTGHLDYEDKLTLDSSYLQESQKNKGKYVINEEGILVSKETGEPEFISGNPFPELDPGDPELVKKIMENFKFTMHYRQGGCINAGYVRWIGREGLTRQLEAPETNLYYWNRRGGPVTNPNHYLQQQMYRVSAPFDLRGTVRMAFTYIDNRVDIGFAYVPMLRRLRRISASARSDPFVGADLTIDDSRGWAGKNASMRWEFIGQGTFLAPFLSTKKSELFEHPDGTIERVTFDFVKHGYEVPGWMGAPWAPISLTWHPRPLWIIKAIPFDPYYAFGQLDIYLDQENYVIYFKIMYNWAGERWKTFLNGSRYPVTQKGDSYIGDHMMFLSVNEKTDHCCYGDVAVCEGQKHFLNVPFDKLNQDYFSESAVRSYSK